MTDDATTGPDESTPASPAPAQPAPAQPPPGPGAFAPVPREPWINPAKRRTAALVAAVVAVALFGSGLLIGALATGGHHHRDRWHLRGYDRYPAGMRGPVRPDVGEGHGLGRAYGHGKHGYRHGGWSAPTPCPPASGPPSATSVPGTPLPSSSHR